MKKKNKKNNKLIIIISIIIVLIILIVLGIYLSRDTDELTKELKKDGYTTTSEDAFYKKITTNNTLDDFYEDISNEKETQYEEYYLSKDSLDFIELKMYYKDGVTTTLNLTSNLRTLEVDYNYELSYKNAYFIIEGNSTDEYTCKTVVQENVSDDTITTYCNSITTELDTFLSRRENMLNNSKVKELLQSPIESVTEDN